VLVKVAAVDDLLREDPHDTLVVHTVNPTNSAPEYVSQAATQRLDVRVLDNETPGVVVTESNDSTQGTLGNVTPHTPGPGDSYTLRLTMAPTSNVNVAVVTDGQADVSPLGSLAMAAVGGATPVRLFNGDFTVSGSTITRANLSALGSFITDGFAKGQLIQVGGTSSALDGNYTIASVSTDGQSMTLTT